jgi:hypothetical protein
MEEKRRGRISFVGLPVRPMRRPLRAACDLVREKLTLLAAACDGSSNQPPVCCMSRRSRRPQLSCFDTDIIAEDGRELEYVFETDEQSAPKTVGEEKATEIAMDWMRVFYHVQVGTIGPLPGPNPHRLSPAIGVTVDPPDGSGTKSLHSRVSHREIESKNPGGLISYQPGSITEVERQHAFPSVTAQKAALFSLSFRPQSQSRGQK